MHSGGFEPTPVDEDPQTFHNRPFGGSGRTLWLPTLAEAPTLVLGSSQSEDDLDLAQLERAGVAVVRRRTGGGAVLVSADDLVWFDVVIDDTDPLWTPDVGRSFDWLGKAVQQAIRDLGIETDRHHGRLIRSEWSDRVCFAGLGPGELTVGGRKVVGMSQRRTRSSARLQVAILRRWDGDRHRQFFHEEQDSNIAATKRTLADAAVGIDSAAGRTVSPVEVIDAVLANLSRLSR